MKSIQTAIVDDSAEVRERLAQMLAQIDGVQIAWQAGSVPEAIAAFHRQQPDAVILDIAMPEGSGMDVLKEIKKNAAGTTVIILTNFPLPQLKQSYLEAGADYFFDKSLEFKKVDAILRLLTAS